MLETLITAGVVVIAIGFIAKIGHVYLQSEMKKDKQNHAHGL